MRTILDKVMRTSGRAKAAAAGLAFMLALALGVATVAPNPQAELARAASPPTDPSPDGQEEAPVDANGQEPVGEVFNRTELYFGSEKPDGSEVTETEFERFVDEEVTPSFPDGLTLLAGEGQFRDSSGDIVEEPSHVLILLYPPDDREANGEIEEIREAYKSEFKQESVLRVDARERVSF